MCESFVAIRRCENHLADTLLLAAACHGTFGAVQRPANRSMEQAPLKVWIHDSLKHCKAMFNMHNSIVHGVSRL